MSAADTRQRILTIAADLFARQGYTGTTIADIARELGTTTAALYYHFPSKADILGGLLAEPLTAYTRIIEGLDENQPEPAELLGAFIDLAVDSRALAGMIDRDPAVLAMIDERLPRTSRQTTEQVIAVLAGPDADRSAVVRAHAALAVIKGATMAALELGGGALDPADREEILQLALGVLRGPQPEQAYVAVPPLLTPFARSRAVTGPSRVSTVPAIGRARWGRWALHAVARGERALSRQVISVLGFDGVTKRFGPVTALDGCTFAVRPGRLTGFLGPNGAGKTTAMRAVFGLVELDAGTVRWHGVPVGTAERARFGYMPEERGLYPRMRVRDQLMYLGQLCGCAARDVAWSVDGWLERLGLAGRAADRLDALSHGNQQRVQLIAALVGGPDLLVLDEPFSGLDPIAMDAMGELLCDVAAGGVTVLFSSHQLDLVQDLCQDVVIIDHGRIVLAGDLAELRARVPQRFVDIRYRGAAPDWPQLASLELVESKDGQARLRVGRDTNLAALVAAALDRADIVSLTYQPPTLSELFREAVAA
jgi:ABC-2 type transport system ATP-binding protein